MRPLLFLHVIGIQARKTMSYRVDFWIHAVLGFVVGIALPYFLWNAVFAESGQVRIGGFTLRTMVLYYVAVALLAKLVRGPDLTQEVATDIYEGGLNRYLLYPTDYLSFKYAQHLGNILPSLVQLTLFGVLVVVYLGGPGAMGVTPGGLAMTAASLAVANLLYFLLVSAVQMVAFWADNVWSLVVLLRFASSLLGGAMLPLAVFPDRWREIVLLTPFPAIFHLPVSCLTGKVTLTEWAWGLAIGIAWCGVAALAARLVWRRGQLGYTGVGI